MKKLSVQKGREQGSSLVAFLNGLWLSYCSFKKGCLYLNWRSKVRRFLSCS